MKITKEEELKIMTDRISHEVYSLSGGISPGGGGAGSTPTYSKAINIGALAKVLLEIKDELENKVERSK